VEGAVGRVERRGVVDFLVKYVRPDKIDGVYLPEISGKQAVWNWHPMSSAILKKLDPSVALCRLVGLCYNA
jgi:hypothetical protein